MQKTKILLLACLLLTAQLGFSQELRGKAKAKKDSIDKMNEEDKLKEVNKFSKFNLSKEQFQKIKGIQSEGKKARMNVQTDNALTPEQKKEKMKELHKEQSKKVMQELTPEQQAKFKELRKDKIKNNKIDND